MARKNFEAPSGSRSSALWGTGNRGGESRSNALWGKGGRGRLLTAIALVAMATPIAAIAGGGSDSKARLPETFIAPSLLAQAQETPNALVKVIIQSSYGESNARNAYQQASKADGDNDPESLKDSYRFVNSVAVTLKAKKVKNLARIPGLTVTPDSPVRLTALPTSKHLWPTASLARF